MTQAGLATPTGTMRVHRFTLWSAGLLMVSLFMLLMVSFALDGGWSRQSWLGLAFGLLAVALVAFITAMGIAASALKRHGITLTRRSRHYEQVPRKTFSFGGRWS